MANQRVTPKDDQAEQDDRRAFDEAYSWYKAHRQELLPKYEGLRVAILDGQVVDSDPSLEALVSRIYAQYGCRDFFTAKVEAVERIHRILSPRLVRS